MDGSSGERWTAIIESSRESRNRRLHEGGGGIVCCGIVGPSWKSQPVRVRRYRGPGSALPSAIPPYINSGSNGFFSSVVGRRGEVLLYRGYPHRDIERVYTPPRLSFMIHLPPPLYNNARPPPSFVIYASLNFELSFFPSFSTFFRIYSFQRNSTALDESSFRRR